MKTSKYYFIEQCAGTTSQIIHSKELGVKLQILIFTIRLTPRQLSKAKDYDIIK